jgi:hypothetical protein
MGIGSVFDRAEWIRVHRKKARQLKPRQITAPNRLTAIARDRRRRAPFVPDRRSDFLMSLNHADKKISGPNGHNAQCPSAAVTGNAGHEGPFACAPPTRGIRKMILFLGLPVALSRDRSRVQPPSSGCGSATMAGRQPPLPRNNALGASDQASR